MPPGLLLARSVARARETAIRVALGAGRGQLAAHYFAESLLVSLAGAAGGIVLSFTLTPAIVSMAADYLPRAEEIAVDWTVLLFALGAAFVASALSQPRAALAGCADRAGRRAWRRRARLRQRTQPARVAVARRRRNRARLCAAGGRARSSSCNSGVSRAPPRASTPIDVLTFVLSVPGTIADDRGTRVPHQRRLIEAVQTIPGVDDVALREPVAARRLLHVTDDLP